MEPIKNNDEIASQIRHLQHDCFSAKKHDKSHRIAYTSFVDIKQDFVYLEFTTIFVYCGRSHISNIAIKM